MLWTGPLAYQFLSSVCKWIRVRVFNPEYCSLLPCTSIKWMLTKVKKFINKCNLFCCFNTERVPLFRPYSYSNLNNPVTYFHWKILALARIWTRDLPGAKPICYQLSYPGLDQSLKLDFHPPSGLPGPSRTSCNKNLT